jgi:hypothetical protein
MCLAGRRGEAVHVVHSDSIAPYLDNDLKKIVRGMSFGRKGDEP